MEQDRLWYLYFSCVPSIGRKTLRKLRAALRAHQVEYSEVLALVSQQAGGMHRLLATLGLTERQIDAVAQFRSQFAPHELAERLRRSQIQTLLITDEHYPQLLRHAPDPPEVLFYTGDARLFEAPLSIGVVGTRKPTRYGLRTTEHLLAGLSGSHALIVSGFMFGIDAAAHRAALSYRLPTVGVLGYGLDQLYPARHRSLRARLLSEGGLLVSEYPPWQRPLPGQFPERNRIIAGLSQAVVVVEAAEHSGSHITARCALDAGRDVGVVAGSIFNPFSAGTHWLLQQGAAPIRTANDILELVGSPRDRGVPDGLSKRAVPNLENQCAQVIWQLLGDTHLSIGAIVIAPGLDSYAETEILAAIAELELAGFVERAGSDVSRRIGGVIR